MRKYIWLVLGYITALATIFMASCTYAPRQADYDTPGHSAAFPLFVKIID